MDSRRSIPPVGRLLDAPEFEAVLRRWPRAPVVAALRDIQDRLRARMASGAPPPRGMDDAEWYARLVARRLRAGPSLQAVLNATGVILHTNLGRAPLAIPARKAVARITASYSSLEFDLRAGGRGSRQDHCAPLLRELTGAQASLVVTNNAAAVLLALNTLASGREAVISRGELVEIGGSFRVPAIMERSGARMVEVGSTNRTHLRDYEEVLSHSTGAILKVHRSNFRIRGFQAEVPAATLAGLARRAGVPLLHDLGSGLLMDLSELGLPPEPTARDALEAGADLVTMSGDKVLGGPQSGVIVGRADLVDRLRRNPMARALRPDKMTLAALEATLRIYREPERARREIPVLAMMAASDEELRGRADRVAGLLADAGLRTDVERGVSTVGGGAYPGVELPTWLAGVHPASESATAAARRLRRGRPPVIVRVRDDRILLDPRTIPPGSDELLARVVARGLLR